MPETSARRGAAGPAHDLRQFHPFPRLPIEIQLIIWSLWREENRGVVRHYLCYCKWGSDTKRVYLALSNKARAIVEPPEEVPVDPMAYKIEFTQPLFTFTDMTRAHQMGWYVAGRMFELPEAWEEIDDRRRRGRPPFRLVDKPAVAWANFETDIFFIDNSDFNMPGRLTPVLHTMGHERKLWPSWIRTLALDSSCNGHEWDVIEGRALELMESLRTIYLVYRLPYLCSQMVDVEPDGDHGFKDAEAYQRQHLAIVPNSDDEQVCCGDMMERLRKAGEWVEKMQFVLRNYARRDDVEVRAVVDILWR